MTPPTDSPRIVPALLHRIRTLAHRSVRDREKCYWLEGIRQFVQAHDAGIQFDTIVYSRVLVPSDLAKMLVRRLKIAGARVVPVSPEQFRQISITARASGIGAIAHQRWDRIEQADPRPGVCHLLVESIRSPGNLGTILRTAEACGAGGVIFLGPRGDPFDPAVVRASMGGLFHLQLIRTDPQHLRSWASRHGMHIVGLCPAAELAWTDLPRADRILLALGEERAGLRSELRALCETNVRLPMSGRADSLNVSIAAGVMLYELVRRQISAAP
jgi:RNA methyltransferase, TrmH family